MREKVRFFFAVWSIGFREINIFWVLGKIWDVMMLDRKFIFCWFFSYSKYDTNLMPVFLYCGSSRNIFKSWKKDQDVWECECCCVPLGSSKNRPAKYHKRRPSCKFWSKKNRGRPALYLPNTRLWNFSNTHTQLRQMYVQEMEVGGKINTLCSTHVRSIVDQFECNRRLPLL